MATTQYLTFLTSSSSFFTPQSSNPKPTPLSLHFPSRNHLRQFSVKAEVATLPILNFEGEKVGETFLNLKTAPPETARSVVHRGVVTTLAGRRRGTASTLTRAEVRGGGKKPYPQKGTGGARRGSQRTPLRPGGGVVFGPKPKDWSIKMNKKEKRLALSTAIASAASAGSSIVVEEFGDKFSKPKTRDFVEAMNRWGLDPKVKAMFFMMDLEANVEKSGRNIGTLKLLTPRTLNLYDVLDAERLVFTPEAVEYLNETYGADDEDDDEEYDEEDGEDEGETIEQRIREARKSS